MKRVIEDLNEMSFCLPDGWVISTDKYFLQNGQGFINCENYISPENKVVSLFQIQRDPDEFFEHYHNLVGSYDEKKDEFVLVKQFSILVNGFSFPLYILKGVKQDVYIVEIFINCGDALGCFIFKIENFDDDKQKLLEKNQIMKQVSQILRTIE
ncbi:MAG: hypothetical protein E7379_00905 [Clostridiales bacterium]|nr:hypothetical protein [Clostridiales bacterium]